MWYQPSKFAFYGTAISLFTAAQVSSATYIWNGLGSNNDLTDQNNWLPNTNYPQYNDIAEFNSTITNINTSPTSNGNDFAVDSFNFTNSASTFEFNFNNCELTLSGNGITGLATDTTININNINNATDLDSNLVLDSNISNSIGNAVININNAATLTGDSITNTSLSYCSEQQIYVNGPFSMGNGGRLISTNSGVDNTTNSGNNEVAVIDYEIALFGDTVTLGNNVVVSISNSGESNGSNNQSGQYVASTVEGGVVFDGAFSAGNNLSLSITNTGKDTSTGVGNNETAYIETTPELEFDDSCTLGDNAVITVINRGNNSSNTTSSGNSTGYISDDQLYFRDTLTAGNNLSIHVTNEGTDSSTGEGGHSTGYISGAQFNAHRSVDLIGKNNTSIIVENTGTYTGTAATNPNEIGYINGEQVYYNYPIDTGNNFILNVSNYGEDHGGSGAASNVAYINAHQLVFEDSCSFGDNATISIANKGVSTTTAADQVAVVSGGQMAAYLNFTAGKNLNVTATNEASISGNATAGYISGHQLGFYQTFTTDDGAYISASNLGSGTVDGSQIFFQQGFDINGKATFQAVNEGTLGGYGIEVQGGTGGNVNIILGNSSLYISSAATDFTIGALNGDSTSFVQSLPTLIINTDEGVSANFAGNIQDYSSPSTLVKNGSGIQKLSGTNTLTGLTDVQEGTLILTGSLGGNVNVAANGILKGTGSVIGNVFSTGTIAPGESIGTIHFLSNFSNNGGNYDVEVNGLGQSDLISVTGDANINGGLVIVNTVDGTYKFQDRYTIVETGGARTGFFTGANAISTMIQPVVTYDDQHVYLELFTNIANVAETPNQCAIATQLDGIIDPSTEQTLLLSELVDLSRNYAREALDSLSGYQHGADLISSQMINRQFIRRLYDPIRSIVTTEPCCCCNPCCDCCCQDFAGWLDVGGSFININNHGNDHGMTTNGYNLTAGVQTSFCNDMTFGVAASYEHDFLNFKRSGWERCNTWLFGVYGLYRPSCFYTLADFTYGNSSNHLKRKIHVGELEYTAKSNPDTYQYTVYGEAGVDINLCNVLFQPFFGFEAGSFHRKRTHESYAGGWGLDVDKRNKCLTTTRLGMHVTSNDQCTWGNVSLDLAWNYLASGYKNHFKERFTQFGTPFCIDWTKLDRNSVDYTLTLVTRDYCNWQGWIEGSGESWKNANIFNVTAGVEYCW